MANAGSLSVTPKTRWQEFDQSLCDDLNDNEGRWLCLVGDATCVAGAIPHIESACRRLSCSPAASTAPFLASLPTAFSVKFTAAKHQMMGEDCLAAHGRTPFFAVVDFTDEDDQYSFILSLGDRHHADSTEELVASFLQRIAEGKEPRAPQGLRPTVGNFCPFTHGTLLVKGTHAVAGNMPTVQRNPYDPDCGTVGIFWSDRCPCCPGGLMMVELLVDLIDRVAAHHHTKAHGAHADELEREGAGRALRAVPCRRLHYISCNIDDNDYTAADWPRDEEEQVVPTIVVFRPDRARTSARCGTQRPAAKVPRMEAEDRTHEATTAATARPASESPPPPTSSLPRLERLRFRGSRTPEELVEFFCRECLPPDCECTRHITDTAVRIARGLSGEELMRCIDDHDPVATLAKESFERANNAYLAFLGARTARAGTAEAEAEAATLHLKTAEWSKDVRGAYAAARRSLVDMEEVTKRALARMENHAVADAARGRSTGKSDEDATNTPSANQDCCCAYRPAFLSRKSSPSVGAAPFTPPPDTSASAGDAIHSRFLVDLTTHDDVLLAHTPTQAPLPLKRGRDASITDVSEVFQSAITDQ